MTDSDFNALPKPLRELHIFSRKSTDQQERFDDLRDEYELPSAIRMAADDVTAEHKRNERLRSVRNEIDHAIDCAHEEVWGEDEPDLFTAITSIQKTARRERDRTERELITGDSMDQAERKGLRDALRSLKELLSTCHHFLH